MKRELSVVASRLINRGILAADESPATLDKRFQARNIPQNPETRRQWRQLLFTSFSKSTKTNLSGVILQAETLTQKTDLGDQSLVELLTTAKIIPGIKVDLGTQALSADSPELVTGGIVDLEDRLRLYLSEAPALQFAKWRAVIKIDPAKHLPSNECLALNSRLLSRYAQICQSHGLLPILEPEVVRDGKHTIEQCAETTRRTLLNLFYQLRQDEVDLTRILLKINMIVPGKEFSQPVEDELIAQRTLEVLRETVPFQVPGIVFLSGGQTPDEATLRLNAIAQADQKNISPWRLSFSFARALQDEAMDTWSGESGNVLAAQAAFEHRLNLVSAASNGTLSV